MSLYKVKAYYLDEARGLLDEEFIDDVGYGLYFRCASILEYTEAMQGRVKCKRCAKPGTTTMIERKIKKTTEFVKCPI